MTLGTWLTGAATLVLALAVGGCGADGTDTPAPSRTDWPQPVNGKLTPEMCDLLGPDDYSAAGAVSGVFEDRELVPESGPNFLSCHSAGQNWLTLNLQPDSVSAGYYYAYQLKQYGTVADARENVLPATDESWYGTADDGHDLLARRGALLASIHLGFLNDDADQFTAATKLLGVLLSRIPDVGTTATGKPHHAVLTVGGNAARTGPVDVSFMDPNTLELVEEKGITLPYSKTIDFAWYGQTRALTLYARPQKPVLNNYLTCAIALDGKMLDEGTPALAPTCRGEYSDRTP